MTISATELKNNLGKYIELASREEISITKNGKEIIKMVPSEKQGLAFLSGLLKDYSYEDDGMDNRELKWERIKYE